MNDSVVEKKGPLFIKAKEEVAWGSDIVIEGHFTVKSESEIPPFDEYRRNFSPNIKVPTTNEYRRESPNMYLEKLNKLDKDFQNRLLKTKDFKFSDKLLGRYGILPPGEYELFIDYGSILSNTIKLKITAVGWRAEFANFVVQEFCSDRLEKAFGPFFVLQKGEETNCEGTPPPELEQKWREGYTQYSSKLSSWTNSIKSIHKLDTGFYEYSFEVLKKSCPSKVNKKEQLIWFYSKLFKS